MNELIGEYKNQKEYYETEDKEDRLRKLISDRLYNSLVSSNSICEFGFTSTNTIEIIPSGEGKFLIRIDGINEKQANLLNWILTSEYFYTHKDQGSILKKVYSWYSSSLEETSEKTYRVLEEFFGYNDSDELRDFAL